MLTEALVLAVLLAGDDTGLAERARPGPAEVTCRDFSVVDQAREKELLLRATWPEGQDKCPVIVFSHGMFGSRKGYAPLVEHWASHGFVVLQPTHLDSLELESPAERALGGPIGRRVRDPAEASSWRDRVEDVAFVLDLLETLPDLVEELAGRIDRERIGVGGHSFGAHTTILVAGATLKVPLLRKRLDLSDPRPIAFLVLSPQGPGNGLDATSFAGITRPTLFVTGSRDASPRDGRLPAWRRQAFELSPPGERCLLWLEGADHGLGGISGAGRLLGHRDDAGQLACVQAVTTAWWDAFLKNDEAARMLLNQDAVTTLAGEGATFERKAEAQAAEEF
ncbi:MAG: chlorophyllase [Planctomycetes bacterium]|nr:chlorophyllase [Planctomycetota bacterium]